MKVVYNKYIPFKGFLAINLFGVVFVREELKHKFTVTVENHEEIHTKQMQELAFVGFYIWYVIEYVIRLVQYRNPKAAYRNICFEREAKDNEHDKYYPENRRHYSFIRYIHIYIYNIRDVSH